MFESVISDYFRSKLKLSPITTKTKVMHFDKELRRYSIMNSPVVMVDGIKVKVVHEFKYLGVWIDHKL